MIELKDDNPLVVQAMIYYLYHFDYSDTINEQGTSLPLVFNVHIHTIADKYDIPELLKLAAKKFSARAEVEWDTKALADAIRGVYTEAADPNRELRNTVLEVSSKHAYALFRNEFEAFNEVAASVPSFAGELGARIAVPPESDRLKKKYGCRNGNCGFTFAVKELVQHQNYYCPCCGGSRQGYQWEQWAVE